MKRFLCLLCVMLCAFSSCSAARKVYPSFNGTVCDDAAVLSQQTINDIEALNEALSPSHVYVYTCHFLGGDDVKAYTEELFNELYLDADDVLLTIVVGEEKYALHCGEMINSSVSVQQTLLGYNFATPFMQREYDRAVGDFLLAFAPRIARVHDMEIDTNGLFGTKAAPADDELFELTENWWSGFFGERYEDEDIYIYEPYIEVETEEEQSLGSIILLVFLLVFIIRRRRDKGKKGLGFWGWIIGFACLRAVLRFIGV